MASKALGLRKELWLILFILSYTLIIAMMIGSIFTKSWYFTNNKASIKNYEVEDSDVNHFKGKDFKGSLMGCYESCDASYKKLSDEWCDLKELLLEINYYGDENDRYYYMTYVYAYSVVSLCSTFQNLDRSMKIYLAGEVFAIICAIGIVILLGLSFLKIKIRYLIFIFSIMACVAHLEGFITSMVLTKTNFNGWCDDFPYYAGISIELCAGSGPALGLAISVLLPLTSVFFCVFRFLKVKKVLEESKQ
jgi:hypothetical protein